ncbi:hypothetical protein FACS1894178_9230 [Bacteroidia bacterium]|nr:hypothetical protein FACS1894178_9230 [Bacteroidia bacterium]
MKTKIKYIAIILTILALATAIIFTACKKTEKENEDDITLTKSIPIQRSNNNPFDRNHEYLKKMFDDVTIFLSNTQNNSEYENFELFLNDFEKTLAKYETNYPYKHFDINEYDAKTQNIVQEVIGNYINNVNNYGLSKATEQTEKQISKLLNHDLQQSMYSLVSELKFTLSLLKNIENIFNMRRPNWEQRFVACLEKKADAQFGSNSNWIDWAAFLWNPPANFAWWIGSCSWNATFN